MVRPSVIGRRQYGDTVRASVIGKGLQGGVDKEVQL